MNGNGPSEHLSWSELGCHDGTEYPLRWREDRAKDLAAEFEIVRARAGGKPIPVLSGYRTPKWNKAVGGAPLSQHVYGRALDIKPPKGMSVSELYAICKQRAQEPGGLIRGLGLYASWVHMDIRPGSLVEWKG